MFLISFIQKLKYVLHIKSLFYSLGRIGIKKSKLFVYMIDLKNKTFSKENLFTLPSLSIRRCTKEDLNRLPKEDIKSKFQRDLEREHIMIGAFFKGDIVGYAWLSFHKVYVPELETWVNFNGGYGWKWYVKRNLRKKGLGKKIVEHALKIAEEKSETKKVYTIVDINDIPAQRALESIGFKKQRIISYYRFFNLKRRSEKKLESLSSAF